MAAAAASFIDFIERYLHIYFLDTGAFAGRGVPPLWRATGALEMFETDAKIVRARYHTEPAD
ncbi:hypothetical protein [Burkholderia sp. Bp9140]|uniref:hypothetical protein n=1 Tax=Burkholderia sp. Bp9140 TaxID=2184572 RepID=UPI001629C130|nr:hypothetical protein [Burkholderia sp. Bp9140]